MDFDSSAELPIIPLSPSSDPRGSCGSHERLIDLVSGWQPEVEELRRALSHLTAADRRLRGRDRSRPEEVTVSEIRSLAMLAKAGEMTAGQLARSVDLNPATVTAMLDRLEAADIVRRDRSTKDRRVYNVSLTDRGWRELDGKVAAWREKWEQKLAGFTQGEISTAVRVIDAVTELYAEVFDALGAHETDRVL